MCTHARGLPLPLLPAATVAIAATQSTHTASGSALQFLSKHIIAFLVRCANQAASILLRGCAAALHTLSLGALECGCSSRRASTYRCTANLGVLVGDAPDEGKGKSVTTREQRALP